jgi:hypothetical protein
MTTHATTVTFPAFLIIIDPENKILTRH